MFYSLKGKLIYTDATTAVVECGGVGYKCTVTYNTLRQLPEKGDIAMLYTHLNVREDAVDLFGFATSDEQESFKLLISVNGVGPKAAIAILSEFTPDKLALSIASGDSKAITRANGVGPKLAQRIVLELKDKIASGIGSVDMTEAQAVSNAAASGNMSEAISALVSLGYSQSEASLAVSKVDSSLSVEEIIKQALKNLF
ncbi:MAG: Holliday junction branch migration protein RuvA [Clostridia bacterium]|nr:Holliday junction branch migration protein RuvA [Clostridia bacterium]